MQSGHRRRTTEMTGLKGHWNLKVSTSCQAQVLLLGKAYRNRTQTEPNSNRAKGGEERGYPAEMVAARGEGLV